MVSFFGLKFGAEKKKDDEPSPSQSPARQFDRETLDDGQFVPKDLARSGTGYAAAIYSTTARPSSAHSNKFKPAKRKYSLNVPDTHASASTSEIPRPSTSHATTFSFSTSATVWGNSSAPDLAGPPPVLGAGARRPSTSSAREKAWVNPLDVHFSKDSVRTSALPAPLTQGLRPSPFARKEDNPPPLPEAPSIPARNPMRFPPPSPPRSAKTSLENEPCANEESPSVSASDKRPVRRDSSPLRRDSSPLRRGASPFRRGTSPFSREQSPFRRDESPLRQDSNRETKTPEPSRSGLVESESSFGPSSLPSPPLSVVRSNDGTAASTPVETSGEPMAQNSRGKPDTLAMNLTRQRSLKVKVEGIETGSTPPSQRPGTSAGTESKRALSPGPSRLDANAGPALKAVPRSATFDAPSRSDSPMIAAPRSATFDIAPRSTSPGPMGPRRTPRNGPPAAAVGAVGRPPVRNGPPPAAVGAVGRPPQLKRGDGPPPRQLPPPQSQPRQQPPPQSQPQGPPRQQPRPQGPPHQQPRPQGPPHQQMRPQGPPHQQPRPQGPPHQQPRPNGPPHQQPRPQGPPHQQPRPNGPPHQQPRPQGPPSQQQPRPRMPPQQQPRQQMPPHQQPRPQGPPQKHPRPHGPPNQQPRPQGPPQQQPRQQMPPHQQPRPQPQPQRLPQPQPQPQPQQLHPQEQPLPQPQPKAKSPVQVPPPIRTDFSDFFSRRESCDDSICSEDRPESPDSPMLPISGPLSTPRLPPPLAKLQGLPRLLVEPETQASGPTADGGSAPAGALTPVDASTPKPRGDLAPQSAPLPAKAPPSPIRWPLGVSEESDSEYDTQYEDEDVPEDEEEEEEEEEQKLKEAAPTPAPAPAAPAEIRWPLGGSLTDDSDTHDDEDDDEDDSDAEFDMQPPRLNGARCESPLSGMPMLLARSDSPFGARSNSPFGARPTFSPHPWATGSRPGTPVRRAETMPNVVTPAASSGLRSGPGTPSQPLPRAPPPGLRNPAIVGDDFGTGYI